MCEANLGEKTGEKEEASGEFFTTEEYALKYTNLFIWESAEALWLQVARGRERKRERGRTNKLFSHLLSQSCLEWFVSCFDTQSEVNWMIEMHANDSAQVYNKCKGKWQLLSVTNVNAQVIFSITEYFLLSYLAGRDDYSYS